MFGGVALSKRFFIVFAVVCTAAIGVVGFSMLRPDGAADTGQQPSSSASKTQAEPQRTSQQEPAERDQEEGREAVANSGSGGSGIGEVTLKLSGEPGVAFSGSCAVDGESRQVSGETPETFTYEPEERLECEITSQGGPLRVTFSDGQGTNTTQTVGSGSSSLELTYDGDSFASSTSSGSQASSSQTSSSQASSSQSVIQQSSSSVTQSGAE